jgi:biotin carboxylase
MPEMESHDSSTLRSAGSVDISRVTHVVAGFSAALLNAIERNFTAGQVLFVEEPDVVEMRKAQAICDEVPAVAGIVSAPSQDENGAEALTRLVPRPPRLKAVLPGVEYGVVAAAVLAEAWGVPGAGIEAARALRNKAQLRGVADAAKIPQPAWALVDNPGQIAEFRAFHGGRCVVKPTDRQGSLGVELVEAGDDVHEIWQEVLAVQEPGGLRARQRLRDSKYIVEERMSGTEISVQALVANGRTVFTNTTFKDLLPGRYPVELGHTVPAPIPEDSADEVIQQTRRLIRAAGFHYGMLHAEWIVGETGPGLVECAARTPGDKIINLIDLAYRSSIMDDLLRVMEGETVLMPERPRLAASICFLTAPQGTVAAVSGIEQAWTAGGIVEVDVTASEGSEVRPLRSSLDRLGSAIAVALTPEEARESANRAISQIRVQMR